METEKERGRERGRERKWGGIRMERERLLYSETLIA